MYAGVCMCVHFFFVLSSSGFCYIFWVYVLYCVCFCVQCFRVNMAMIRSPRWNKQKNVQNTHNLTFHNTTTTKNNSQQYGVPKQFPLVVKCIGISRECFVLIWYQWESDDNDDDHTPILWRWWWRMETLPCVSQWRNNNHIFWSWRWNEKEAINSPNTHRLPFSISKEESRELENESQYYKNIATVTITSIVGWAVTAAKATVMATETVTVTQTASKSASKEDKHIKFD